MIRILTVLLFLICVAGQMQAQSSLVKVTLKNGTVVKGELKEFNPTEFVLVRIAGVDSKISMTDVKSVESINLSTPKNEKFDTKQIGMYEIADQAPYPETYDLNLNGQTIKMRLVRGGTFNMGYDGRGSLSMKSEPVHPVTLSSYYISEDCIEENIAYYLLGKEKKSNKKQVSFNRWKEANQIVENLANQTHQPYRLLTEAEWEYAALMPFADDVWGPEKYVEWCSDYAAEYTPQPQVNPKGPIKGDKHVIRSYRCGENKWDRRLVKYNYAYFRIAISADALQ